MIEAFHFLRPNWLWALIPSLLIWWQLRRSLDPGWELRDEIAPHLLQKLVVRPQSRHSWNPLNLLLPSLLLAVLAAAGPAFRQQPSPFAEDKAALMLVIRMDESLSRTDLRPSRLERIRTKVHDLMELRAGSQHGLVVYSGSAHLVMPPTADAEVIDHMLQSLDPGVMPRSGDQLIDALDLADRRLVESQTPGSILWIADQVSETQVSQLAEWHQQHPGAVQLWAPLPPDTDLTTTGLTAAAQALNSSVTLLSPDAQDIQQLARRSESAIVSATSSSVRWQDDGYWLIPILLGLLLFWSRRGWSLETGGLHS